MRYVRGKTRHGRALVDWLMTIADGTAVARRQVANKDGGVTDLEERPSHRERLVAIRELWDRGMGTAVAPDKLPIPETPDEEESADDGGLTAPPLPPAVEAAIDGSRGGDAGDVGKGNGGTT